MHLCMICIFMYMYISIWTCIRTCCMFIYMYIFICTCIRTCTRTCTYLYIYIYKYMPHVHMCKCVDIYKHMHRLIIMPLPPLLHAIIVLLAPAMSIIKPLHTLFVRPQIQIHKCFNVWSYFPPPPHYNLCIMRFSSWARVVGRAHSSVILNGVWLKFVEILKCWLLDDACDLCACGAERVWWGCMLVCGHVRENEGGEE